MAQGGDTITYTFSDGTSVAEDVSSVDTAEVDYLKGAGGGRSGVPGGLVKNAKIDVSNVNSIFIWVGEQGTFGSAALGRYDSAFPPPSFGASGGASTEISFSNTEESESSDEPFLVAAGGGAGIVEGARGGAAEGVAPPRGGNTTSDKDPEGDGAIDDLNRGLVNGGFTDKGGGSENDGEVQISYISSSGSVKKTDGSGVVQTDGSAVIQTQP